MAFLKHATAVWIAAVVMTGGAALAEGPLAVPEEQVKAAFLFNFLKFVEWPDQSSDGPWLICVAGRSEFAGLLEETVRDRVVNGRKVTVRRLAEAKDCHLLFIPGAEFAGHAMTARAGILAVGESSGFIEAGGALNLYLESNRVRFEVRPEAARAAGLRISPQLLKLGTLR